VYVCGVDRVGLFVHPAAACHIYYTESRVPGGTDPCHATSEG
jgi:hypothetical protein